jgi:adenylyltransferase/sulfurtransferase
LVSADLTREEILRYSRHLLIPDVGLAGQRRLKQSSALVIGAGGLGSPVALYLAAAGVGRIGLVDHDDVESSNLQRQVLHGVSSVGKRKVESARTRLLDLNPAIEVETHDRSFSAANALEIAGRYDIVVDGTDNFPTRYLSNDVCVMLGKPNVYAAIYRFDGQVSVFDARVGPCYRCLFPEPPPPGLVPSCAEGGVLGVLPGTIGTLQATEVLKLLLGIGEPLIGRLLLYDALSATFEVVKLKKNPACRVCGPNADVKQLVDYDEFCGVSGHDQISRNSSKLQEITAEQLSARRQAGSLHHRRAERTAKSRIEGATCIPLGELARRISELSTTEEIVVFCKSGVRSLRGVELLLSAGFRRVRHLKGGINAWAVDVDPSLPVY